MNIRLSFLLAVTAIAAAASCSTPAGRVEPRAPAFKDTGTTLTTIAMERAVRYYG